MIRANHRLLASLTHHPRARHHPLLLRVIPPPHLHQHLMNHLETDVVPRISRAATLPGAATQKKRAFRAELQGTTRGSKMVLLMIIVLPNGANVLITWTVAVILQFAQETNGIASVYLGTTHQKPLPQHGLLPNQRRLQSSLHQPVRR